MKGSPPYFRLLICEGLCHLNDRLIWPRKYWFIVRRHGSRPSLKFRCRKKLRTAILALQARLLGEYYRALLHALRSITASEITDIRCPICTKPFIRWDYDETRDAIICLCREDLVFRSQVEIIGSKTDYPPRRVAPELALRRVFEMRKKLYLSELAGPDDQNRLLDQ